MHFSMGNNIGNPEVRLLFIDVESPHHNQMLKPARYVPHEETHTPLYAPLSD